MHKVVLLHISLSLWLSDLKPDKQLRAWRQKTFICLLKTSAGFFSISACPGITPFLQKTVKPPSTRAMTGFMEDLDRKGILYVFGFTRNNAG
ncbi:hypothetical protein ACXOF6_004421 [Escherichia coli]|nr:hypothetical protein [Escherichia coli]